MESGGKGAVVGTMIAALIIGGIVGFAFGNNSSDSTNNNQASQSDVATDAPAADLRVALNNALTEHVALAGVALRDAFDGAPTTEAALASLDENSVEVAGLVGSVYGEEAEEQFLELWRQHITFFADYTIAAKNGNQQGMDKALEDLAGYGEQASAFFANANPNLTQEAVKPLLIEHRNLVIDTVNAYGAGNFEESFNKEIEANNQIKNIADALAGAIAQQFPEKF